MENVIICGLGAVGLTYAMKFKDKCNLKILVDKERLEKYCINKPVFNGIKQDFSYILPSDEFKADLIIISTKAQGLDSAIQNIRNFVTPNTKIISLLNGISSEKEIKNAYPDAKVLKSYFIGHSAVRVGNSVTQDGVGEIVLEKDNEVINFFDKLGIDYQIPKNMDYSLWLKFTMNVFSNQTSAILNLTFGEMKNSSQFISFAKKIINEVKQIAQKENVLGIENLEIDALNALSKMCDEGKTSMLQDILAGRKTEVDIFAGEIIKLGEKYHIPTPYNQVLYDLIKIKENVKEKNS